MEAKLAGLGKVSGLFTGKFGEISEDTHLLVAAMANSRAWVVRPRQVSHEGRRQSRQSISPPSSSV